MAQRFPSVTIATTLLLIGAGFEPVISMYKRCLRFDLGYTGITLKTTGHSPLETSLQLFF
jgi:hypothetical protein